VRKKKGWRRKTDTFGRVLGKKKDGLEKVKNKCNRVWVRKKENRTKWDKWCECEGGKRWVGKSEGQKCNRVWVGKCGDK